MATLTFETDQKSPAASGGRIGRVLKGAAAFRDQGGSGAEWTRLPALVGGTGTPLEETLAETEKSSRARLARSAPAQAQLSFSREAVSIPRLGMTGPRRRLVPGGVSSAQTFPETRSRPGHGDTERTKERPPKP